MPLHRAVERDALMRVCTCPPNSICRPGTAIIAKLSRPVAGCRKLISATAVPDRWLAFNRPSPKSFTQINDFVKQRVTASAACRLIQMGFRFVRGFFRRPEREGKLPTGSDHGKWSLAAEPSSILSPLLRGFHTPRRCAPTLAHLLYRSLTEGRRDAVHHFRRLVP